MFVVKFENSKGQIREIGKAEDEKAAFAEINKFLEEHNFKSYYARVMKLNDKEKMIDVGSHTEFFYLEEK